MTPAIQRATSALAAADARVSLAAAAVVDGEHERDELLDWAVALPTAALRPLAALLAAEADVRALQLAADGRVLPVSAEVEEEAERRALGGAA
jgi:hypothetical protein